MIFFFHLKFLYLSWQLLRGKYIETEKSHNVNNDISQFGRKTKVIQSYILFK